MADIPLISTTPPGAGTAAPSAAANTINPAVAAVNTLLDITIPGLSNAVNSNTTSIGTLNSSVSSLNSTINSITGNPVSGLTAATLPLTGTEQLYVVQNGNSRRTTVGAVNPSASPKQYVDPRDFNGWDPTGVNGISAIMQTMIAQAITAHFPIVIPPGVYLVDTPIDVGVNLYDGPQIIGLSTPCNTIGIATSLFNHGASVIFKSTNVNLMPFYNSRALRGAYFANIAIAGPNGLNINVPANDFKANYNVCSGRDSQYSPLCGFALDCFGQVGAPSDGGYPGMSAKYIAVGGSSVTIFQNVMISGFVVGWAVGLVGTQADTMLFDNCAACFCDTGVANGNSQARNTTWRRGQMTYLRQGFDGVNYGPGSGNPINMRDINWGNVHRMFNYGSTYGTLTSIANYTESVRSIGNFGTGSSSSRDNCIIQSQPITMGNGAGIPQPPIIFDTYGLAAFRDTKFIMGTGAPAAHTWNLCNDITSPIQLDSCVFSGFAANTLPYIGMAPGGSVVTANNCIVTQAGSANQAVSDNSSIDVSAFSFNNAFSGTPRASAYGNGTGEVDLITPTVSCVASVAATGTAINTRSVTFANITGGSTASLSITSGAWGDLTGWYMTTFPNSDVRAVLYTNGSSTASLGNWTCSSSMTTPTATALGVTLTFTATDVTLVQLGDIYFWKIVKQYAGSTQRSVPAWTVTNIAGSAVTCQPLCDVTSYDTVANNGGGTTMQTPQYVWAPSGAALTASMNNSVNLTSVSPVNLLRAGWWISAASGLAANSRVVSTDGAGNVVLNKATTGGVLTGVAMYFARFNTRTQTPTW